MSHARVLLNKRKRTISLRQVIRFLTKLFSRIILKTWDRNRSKRNFLIAYIPKENKENNFSCWPSSFGISSSFKTMWSCKEIKNYLSVLFSNSKSVTKPFWKFCFISKFIDHWSNKSKLCAALHPLHFYRSPKAGAQIYCFMARCTSKTIHWNMDGEATLDHQKGKNSSGELITRLNFRGLLQP